MIEGYENRDGEIWYDGGFVPWREAKLHLLTHGLHYASCVFEGERVYDGRVFALQEHSVRLHTSAQYLDFTLPYTVEEIETATQEAVGRSGIKNGYVRPIAWRGSEVMGLDGRKAKIHVAIAVWEWPNYFGEESIRSGISMCTSRWRKPPPDTAPTQAKSSGLYIICTLSRHEAEEKGFTDALMLDYRGQVAEATGANIFLVQDGKLHTPIPDCFLDGITRQTVMKLAHRRGIETVERTIWPEELSTVQEVFITGTAAEITPVRQIDNHSYQIGTVTRTLCDDFQKFVRQ